MEMKPKVKFFIHTHRVTYIYIQAAYALRGKNEVKKVNLILKGDGAETKEDLKNAIVWCIFFIKSLF